MTNINFPDSPSDGDIFGEHRYNATKGVWEWHVLPGNTTAADFVKTGQVFGYFTEYLVVAGGGAGATGESSLRGGGGGGAGGYRSSVLGESSGENSSAEERLILNGSFSVTVGAGGAAPVGYGVGTSGNDSIFYSIKSDGGGRGSPAGSIAFESGGSGGGAGDTVTSQSGAGTSNQGHRGGYGQNSGSNGGGGGGGGGAASIGSNGASSIGGNGGSAISSSITGSSVARAAGGKGGNRSAGAGSSGSENTGNGGVGGGGANNQAAGGAGGSGVVIFKLHPLAEVSFSAGLTEANGGSGQTVGDYKVYTVTAGTGTVTIS